jgi:hypothetical protein
MNAGFFMRWRCVDTEGLSSVDSQHAHEDAVLAIYDDLGILKNLA